MKIYYTHLNFCREHGRLENIDEKGVECKSMPPREADIIN